MGNMSATYVQHDNPYSVSCKCLTLTKTLCRADLGLLGMVVSMLGTPPCCS